MPDSAFRKWFGHLGGLQGRRVEWPQFIRHVMGEELRRLQENGIPYVGEVYRDRDEDALRHEFHPKQHREDVSVQRLFREVYRKANGIITVGDIPTWLISYEVPNQGNGAQRCANLLGLRLDGSLVVFECKPENGPASPFYALLEGLDYLGHLLVPQNMMSLRRGFDRWRFKDRATNSLSKVPPDFANVAINPGNKHSVVVLAPAEYYAHHRLDAKGVPQQWSLLSDRMWPDSPQVVHLDFAVTDFTPTACSWLENAI